MTTLIIQIIAGMVGVSVSHVAATERLSFAAQEAVTALRYARQLSQTCGTPCGVVFDTDNQRFRVFRGSVITTAPNSGMPGGQYIVTLSTQSDTSGVTISTVSLAGAAGNKTVTFGNVGATSGLSKGLGSTVNSGYVTLSYGSTTKTITIPEAGEPTVN
jgi:hypothetical protein